MTQPNYSYEEIQKVFQKAKQDVALRAHPLSKFAPEKAERIGELMKTIDLSKFKGVNGNTPSLSTYTPTLKANQRAKQTKLFKEALKQTSQRKYQNEKDLAFIDPRLKVKPTIRKKKALTFNDPGTYIKKAHRIRAEARLEKLKQSVAISTHQTGIATAVKLATIQPNRISSLEEGEEDDWWDEYLLVRGVKPCDLCTNEGELKDDWAEKIDWRWITDLIEHPIQPKDGHTVTEIPLLLTKKEHKKLRRQNRVEQQKELREKIIEGLVKPPAPKVRLANLMRVYGAEAVQNPTKLEAYARSQEEERRRQHEAMNASRKLTKEEARAKKEAKLHEDVSEPTFVSVYKVRDLTNPSHKFKVEKNAQQLHMTGVIAVHPTCAVIVVEGNDKKQRKFQQLMMNRINWNEGGGDKRNDCQIVLSMGKVKYHAFNKMEFKMCPTELYAREQFRKCDVEHYWDLAFSKEVLQAAGELDS